jgi:hypothetical protein
MFKPPSLQEEIPLDLFRCSKGAYGHGWGKPRKICVNACSGDETMEEQIGNQISAFSMPDEKVKASVNPCTVFQAYSVVVINETTKAGC